MLDAHRESPRRDARSGLGPAAAIGAPAERGSHRGRRRPPRAVGPRPLRFVRLPARSRAVALVVWDRAIAREGGRPAAPLRAGHDPALVGAQRVRHRRPRPYRDDRLREHLVREPLHRSRALPAPARDHRRAADAGRQACDRDVLRPARHPSLAEGVRGQGALELLALLPARRPPQPLHDRADAGALAPRVLRGAGRRDDRARAAPVRRVRRGRASDTRVGFHRALERVLPLLRGGGVPQRGAAPPRRLRPVLPRRRRRRGRAAGRSAGAAPLAGRGGAPLRCRVLVVARPSLRRAGHSGPRRPPRSAPRPRGDRARRSQRGGSPRGGGGAARPALTPAVVRSRARPVRGGPPGRGAGRL